MNRDVCGICWCPYDDNGACGCKPQTGASMNREDIIRMAREACMALSDKQAVGRNLWSWPMEYQEKPAYREALERFFHAAYAAGAAAEREACCSAEVLNAANINGADLPHQVYDKYTAAIRARGTT